jgi:hypothetical protein
MQKVGFKNPPKNRQFGQPEGNPNGKTSKQKIMEMANAEKATLVRGRLLDAVIEATEAGDTASLQFIEAGVLKLLKDAEDRGLGTAVQSINVESPDGTMTPKPTKIEFVSPRVKNESDD